MQMVRVTQVHRRNRGRPVASNQQRPLRLLHALRRFLSATHQTNNGKNGNGFVKHHVERPLPHGRASLAGAGIVDSLATWPAVASSIEILFTSKVCPTASSNATLACV